MQVQKLSKFALVRTSLRFAALTLLIVTVQQNSFGYSVLTHEAIIDASWNDSIKPLLIKRFPGATQEQLREAHAYAYGGAIIQDMGYYPFGSKFFTDLVHYVRSGDFIENLIAESQDLNEYAFALGAMAHYAADNKGHSIAVNKAVPVLYPKLRARYGNTVTYVEDPTAHLKTEFGFDVVQVAKGKYASENYRDFIGFKVSKPVLERGFKRTYCLELKDLFTSLDLALGTYRRAVSTIIPQMTKVAWETKKDEIEKSSPGIGRDKFVYQINRADYEKEWGHDYDKPGPLSKSLSFLFRVVPKVGPFAPLGFKPPTPEAEKMFLESFKATQAHYAELLRDARNGRVNLPNSDFDTGQPTRAGEYKLADETYGKLLTKLASKNFENLTPDLQRNLLAFYSDPNATKVARGDRKDYRKIMEALAKLKAASVPTNRADRR